MPQTIQIVPKHRYPSIDVYINDNTVVTPEESVAADDNTIKYVFPVACSMGKDNVFIAKNTRDTAEQTFGKSNFKKYGQPYMQALQVLDRDNSKVFIMRVMPENAAYANSMVSVFAKADDASSYADAHLRKFRIKFTSTSVEDAFTKKILTDAFKDIKNTLDTEGYTRYPYMLVNSAGRGRTGDEYSVRMSQNTAYEAEYGIKMYNYEILRYNKGLNLVANYVGTNVTSPKYSTETYTLIDDVQSRYADGDYPVEISVNEDSAYDIYDAYIEFLTDLHPELVDEYNTKFAQYGIPQDIVDGIVPAEDETQAAQVAELNEIKLLAEATEKDNLPDVDEFDFIFGRKVASSNSLPAITFPEKLTDDVDITADDYDANDYTTSEDLVDFSSIEGVLLTNGNDGYFENPRVITNKDGSTTQWTLEDEITECYKNAFNGTYDRRILSKKRIPVSAFFDANYAFEVKEVMRQLAETRDSCPIYFDAGLEATASTASVRALINKFAAFTHYRESVDINSFWVREPGTQKRCHVTVSYFYAPQFCTHVTNNGEHIPFVKDNCILSGFIKNSVSPTIDEYLDETIQELLYDNRFNYLECLGENQYRRAVQNTRLQLDNKDTVSDLLEENNVRTLYLLKRNVEADCDSQIYNFADREIRERFCRIEKLKYNSWEGQQVESINFGFKETEYEFYHSILHLYIDLVFRGLTKHVIVEIDINKRTYTNEEYSTDTVE